MKIRTGFVTNSSSYSSAVINIQSKELVDLLKQYQQLFGTDEGLFYSTLGDDTFCAEWEENTDALGCNVPTTLNGVLDALIDGLGDYRYDADNYVPQGGDSLQKLIQELEKRKQELTDSIKKVNWWYENYSSGEFEPDGARKKAFTYNRRSKKTGGAGIYEESHELADE